MNSEHRPDLRSIEHIPNLGHTEGLTQFFVGQSNLCFGELQPNPSSTLFIARVRCCGAHCGDFDHWHSKPLALAYIQQAYEIWWNSI
jgi:hypothetical protein